MAVDAIILSYQRFKGLGMEHGAWGLGPFEFGMRKSERKAAGRERGF
jgi:hypothetical protein